MASYLRYYFGGGSSSAETPGSSAETAASTADVDVASSATQHHHHDGEDHDESDHDQKPVHETPEIAAASILAFKCAVADARAAEIAALSAVLGQPNPELAVAGLTPAKLKKLRKATKKAAKKAAKAAKKAAKHPSAASSAKTSSVAGKIPTLAGDASTPALDATSGAGAGAGGAGANGQNTEDAAGYAEDAAAASDSEDDDVDEQEGEKDDANQDPHADDPFLPLLEHDLDCLMFLRARKHNPTRAVELYKGFVAYRRKHSFPVRVDRSTGRFAKIPLDEHIERKLREELVVVLPHADKDGRTLIYYRPRNNNPSEWQLSLKAIWFVLERIVEQEQVQICGMTLLGDGEGAGLGNFSRDLMKNLIGSFQGAFPMRVGRIIIANQAAFFRVVWQLMSLFIKPKLLSRILVVGGNHDAVLDFIDHHALPTSVSGGLSTFHWHKWVDGHLVASPASPQPSA